MGNCLFGGLGQIPQEMIKVVTSNGGVMELPPPITAHSITSEFPGHGIFRSQDLFWKPLHQRQELLAGESYYLLPLHDSLTGGGHVRSNSIPNTALVAPYRMSFDSQGMQLKRCHTEVLSRDYGYISNASKSTGAWKVKLVISPEQLVEILSQEARTQELIESVRTVAKCGNRVSSASGFSDHWSLSSSGILDADMLPPEKMV